MRKRYVDPRGNFEILPPQGWTVQEYPQETRGKVAFIHPSGIDLRILTQAKDFKSFEDLSRFCETALNRVGVTPTIKKVEFAGRPAVQREFTFKGNRFIYLDILVGNVQHNIAYGGPAEHFPMYLEAAKRAMESYEAFEAQASPEERRRQLVSAKISLAQLMLEAGDREEAKRYVEEGLRAAPSEARLLELQKRLGK
jgi:hypothetical protein